MTSSERWGNGAEGTRTETDHMGYYDLSPTARKLLKARVEGELFHNVLLMLIGFFLLVLFVAIGVSTSRSTVVIAWDDAQVNVVGDTEVAPVVKEDNGE